MNVGGTARYVGKLVEQIPNSKLATGYVQGSEIEDPCVSELLPLRISHLGRRISLLQDFRAWLELKRIVNDVKPAILHTHTFKAGLIGRLVPGKHVHIHTFHGHLFDDGSFSTLAKFAIRWAERFLARKTDLLISVGRKVGEELRMKKIGIKKKWTSIAPGVDALPSISKKDARNTLSLKEEGFFFGWMARMEHVKNPLLLLEIARKMPGENFVMAGGGNLLEQVRRQAPENVRVIGWADAANFWSAVDCAISTSDNEGMPIALIEAQLAGIPAVVTDVGSNSEVVLDGLTGYVAEQNICKIIESLNKLLRNKAQLEIMGKAAHIRAKIEFSMEKMVLEHQRIYQDFS
jgi:glycosyltransferase involved in cell wall biosynthesis